MQLELGATGHIQQIRQKAAWARKQEDAARERFQQTERARQFWESLADHLSAGNSTQILLHLRQAEGYVRHLKATSDPISPILEEIRRSAEQHATESASAFGREFPDLVRKAGLEIDSTSRHPRYTLKQGFLRVEVDDRDYTARVIPRDGEETVMGMDVVPLVEKIKAEIARIFDRQFQPDALVKSIYTAYIAALRSEGRQEGEEVPLRRVTNRLAKNLNRFAADEFNVDLARLIKSGHLTIDNKRMHLNHTRNQRQGMLLHGLEEGGYVGFVSFRKEGRP